MTRACVAVYRTVKSAHQTRGAVIYPCCTCRDGVRQERSLTEAAALEGGAPCATSCLFSRDHSYPLGQPVLFFSNALLLPTIRASTKGTRRCFSPWRGACGSCASLLCQAGRGGRPRIASRTSTTLNGCGLKYDYSCTCVCVTEVCGRLLLHYLICRHAKEGEQNVAFFFCLACTRDFHGQDSMVSD